MVKTVDNQVQTTSKIVMRKKELMYDCVVVTLKDDSAIYVTGYVANALDGQAYGGGSSDIIVFKYDSSGTKIWTRIIGTTGSEAAYAGV